MLSLVNRLPKTKASNTVAVPFSISIFKRCVDHGIDFSLVKHLHLYDLQCLIFQLEAQRILDYLKRKESVDLQKRDIGEIKDVDGNAALKFLGR